MRYVLSAHAAEALRERRIPIELIESVLQDPGQIVEEREDKKAYQSQMHFETSKLFLLRVIVNDLVDPCVVVTAYRTPNIEKYWKPE